MRLRRFIAACVPGTLAMLAGCPLGNVNPDPAHPGDTDPNGADAPAPGGGDGPHQPGNDPPPKAVPAELVGSWRTILTYVPPIYTGIIDPGDFSGSIGVTYTFAQDGQYRYELDTARTYFGGLCFGSSSWTEWGAIDAGAQLALKPAHATNVSTDSCGDYVFDDNAPTQDSILAFSFEQDPTGWPVLRLTFPTGDEVLLERCRDCQ